ncbi:MAG: sodium-dependent transporter [Planctomycetes bacterium]|nr:sodium-dependent transporter [Planctomycetota bacterium]
MSQREREGWGSRVGLVLAMAGNAVGLGNFLRFPTLAAQNGGGAFLIPYLVSFVLMGIPLLWVEWAIGRHGGQFGHHSAPGMFDRLGGARWLKYVGVFGLFTNLAVAAYYCYIESWTLAYVWHSIAGTFRSADPAAFRAQFLGIHAGSLVAAPGEALFWFLLTLGLNVWILSRGLVRGIELVAKIGMPLLLVFGAVLAIRGLTLSPGRDPGVVASPLAGLDFVWRPQLSGLASPTTWLAAAGQISFTLSVGMGSIHCYAAYVRRDQDIALNAASSGWLNEFVEVVLGGSIVIPIATAFLGLEGVRALAGGVDSYSLGFVTAPSLFAAMGWFAPVAGALWFGLLFFAGITSSLAMGQPVMAFLEDELGVRRSRAALVFGAATLGLGLVCVFFYGSGAFGEFDYWTGTFALVVFALLEAIVFSAIFGIDRGWEEITRGADMRVPRLFRFVIRFVTPAFIAVIFVGSLVQPAGEWGVAARSLASGHGWPLAPDSVIGRVLHVGATAGGRSPLVQDFTRLLLLALFAGCAFLVWLAWRRKRAELP